MKQGITVPSVTFKTRVRDDSIGGDNPFKWQDLTTDEIFKNRRVVVFSLPGAFTPTCSTYQVPGYEKHYDEICAKGVDDIYVLSVNDTFVMRKWMLDQQVEKLKFIPDGSGTFTRQLGMLVDKDKPGRCDNSTVDPYGVSSPETVLEYLNRHEK